MGKKVKKDESCLNMFIVIGVGILNTLWLAYKLAFRSEYLYARYAKYVWSSLENASSMSQKWALFFFVLILIGGTYIAYIFGKKLIKAWIFTIVSVLATIIIGEVFWKVFLFILFLPEFVVLGFTDIFLSILRFFNLFGISTFILGLFQIIMVPFTLFLGITTFYAPLESLYMMFESSGKSTPKSENTYAGFQVPDRDYMDDVRKDRILETLKDIDYELKNR